MVHACEIEQDCAAELEHFLMARLLSLECVTENLVNLFEFEVLCIEVLETVVRNAAAHFVEEVMTLAESIEQVLV